MPVLRWPGATARYSHFRVPVETGTPPRRGKVRSIRNTRQRRLFLTPLPCLSSPNRTRCRWASIWFWRAGKLQRLPADFTLQLCCCNGRMRWELLLPTRGRRRFHISLNFFRLRIVHTEGLHGDLLHALRLTGLVVPVPLGGHDGVGHLHTLVKN